MKVKLEFRDEYLYINLEAETVEEAGSLVKFGMNALQAAPDIFLHYGDNGVSTNIYISKKLAQNQVSGKRVIKNTAGR